MNLFFRLGSRYPLLRPVAGVAAIVAGVLKHSTFVIVVGALVVVVGGTMAVASLRKGGGNGNGGSPR